MMWNPFGEFWLFCFLVIMLWELVWKALALWASARNNQQYWFIAILVINSMGILPIIYLLWFKRKKAIAVPAKHCPKKRK